MTAPRIIEIYSPNSSSSPSFHSLSHSHSLTLSLEPIAMQKLIAHPFLNGKTAIVTGGSGVIGKSIANALVRSGCKVFITGRNGGKLDDAKRDLAASLGDLSKNVFTFVGDVCNEGSVSDLFDTVEKESQQGCDLLINNAGINTIGQIENLSADDFTRVMAVNVVGPFTCAREAIKRMKEREESGGRIINIGSLSAISPRPDSIPYTTSKFALLGLTKSLALDARQYNIAVGIIHPGNVVSTLLTPEMIEERGRLEGFIHADEVASSVTTMASMPYGTNIFELTLMPTKQPFVGRG